MRTWSPRWRGDAHAGRTETSVQLALGAGRVRTARAEAGAAGSLAELLPGLRRSGVLGVSPNGVLGDPTGASSEEGWRLLEDAVADLAILLGEWVT